MLSHLLLLVGCTLESDYQFCRSLAFSALFSRFSCLNLAKGQYNKKYVFEYVLFYSTKAKMPYLLVAKNFKHLCTTHCADAFHCLTAILHCHFLCILHFPLLLALHTVSSHSSGGSACH